MWCAAGVCAYALGLHGEHGTAAAFPGFVARTVVRYRGLYEAVTTAGTDRVTVPQMPGAVYPDRS